MCLKAESMRFVRKIKLCVQNINLLNRWEKDFVRMYEWIDRDDFFTVREQRVINSIYERIKNDGRFQRKRN